MYNYEKGVIARAESPKLDHRLRRVIMGIAAALAISVALNVLLAHRVRSLTFVQSARIAERQLKIGATVTPIQAKRLGGQQEVVSYQQTSQPTVIYVFTPTCSWCARNLDNVRTLVDKESGAFRFIGISLVEEGLEEYVASNALKLPVYSGPSLEMLKNYKLGSTPQTIVVSHNGKVLQDWVGAYVGERQAQIETFFRIHLPGLKELSQTTARN